MRERVPGPAARRYAVDAFTAYTSLNSSESAPGTCAAAQVVPPSTVRAYVASCPLTHTVAESTTLTACSSAVVPPACAIALGARRAVARTGAVCRAHAARCQAVSSAMVDVRAERRRDGAFRARRNTMGTV